MILHLQEFRGPMVKAIGYGLIMGSNPGLAIFFSFFFPKRNKKLSKNMMMEGSNSLVVNYHFLVGKIEWSPFLPLLLTYVRKKNQSVTQ